MASSRAWARRLARLSFVLLSLGLAVPGMSRAAAPLPAGSASAADAAMRERAVQRALLQRQQQQLQAGYAAERSQCMRRFLVFDCLDGVARRERAALAALRARLERLDLLDRQQLAEQERARVRANLAAREAAAAAQPSAVRTPPRRAAPPAGRAAMPRRAASSARAAGARGLLPQAGPRDARPLQAASQARAARAQRLQREKAYRRLQQRARDQQNRTPAAPLPVPPASGPLLLPR